jgi:farnesyl-diphosphate farnesyltransferase
LKPNAHLPLLKGVSRSFYLSLRLLPAPMRRAAALAYLLARASDTLADSANAPAALRLDCLDHFARAIDAAQPLPPWPAAVMDGTPDLSEKRLLAATAALLTELAALPEAEARLIREVCSIIISGQRLDLVRFGNASAAHPVTLRNNAELDDYTWRVAGCVGAFWTKLGYHTLGSRFSAESPELMEQNAIAYGKGLQLVNILRDLPADLAGGRCYLPLENPAKPVHLVTGRLHWIERAEALVACGFTYSAALRQRRLRAASVLPAMIARDTLRLLAAAPGALQHRIKVPRRAVYQSLIRAFIAPPAA